MNNFKNIIPEQLPFRQLPLKPLMMQKDEFEHGTKIGNKLICQLKKSKIKNLFKLN